MSEFEIVLVEKLDNIILNQEILIHSTQNIMTWLYLYFVILIPTGVILCLMYWAIAQFFKKNSD